MIVSYSGLTFEILTAIAGSNSTTYDELISNRPVHQTEHVVDYFGEGPGYGHYAAGSRMGRTTTTVGWVTNEGAQYSWSEIAISLKANIAVPTVGNTSHGSTNGFINTISHTVGTNTKILLVGVHNQDATGTISVTYGGVPLTKITGIIYGGTGPGTSIYYLTNPTPGTANLVITAALFTRHAASVLDIMGAATTSFYSTVVTASGYDGEPTASITSNTNELVVDFVTKIVTSMTDFQSGSDYKVAIIDDDTDVLNNLYQLFTFTAVELVGVLDSVERKNHIAIYSTTSPIELSDSPLLYIQLKQSDGSSDLLESHTINLTVSSGMLSASSVTTNVSGFGSITYYPAKTDIAIITASADTFMSIGVAFPINVPTTAADQNWVQRNDLKDAIIDTDKLSIGAVSYSNLACSAKIAQTGPTTWWFIERPRILQTYGTSVAQNINSIILDDNGFFYLNGFAGPGATNPIVARVDKHSGVLTYYAYSGNNLADGRDGLTYDGRWLYIAAGGNILKINPYDMTLEQTIAVDTTTGTVNALVWTGDMVYGAVEGGTGTYANRVFGMTPSGDLQLVSTDAVYAIKQMSANADELFIAEPGQTRVCAMHEHTGLDATILSTLGLTGASNGGIAAGDNNYIWFSITPSGGTTASVVMAQRYVDVSTTLIATINESVSGRVYELIYDGACVWGITGSPDDVTRRFLKRFYRPEGSSSLEIVQTIDLGSSIQPNDLATDQTTVYIANFASTT